MGEQELDSTRGRSFNLKPPWASTLRPCSQEMAPPFPSQARRSPATMSLLSRTVVRSTAHETAASLSSSTLADRSDCWVGRGRCQDVEGPEGEAHHLGGHGLRSQRGAWTDSWRRNSCL